MNTISNKWRQKLHLEPPQGWLNDPNGLCEFNGKYHVFFQYSPKSANGEDKKCWGHYESPDLTRWEFAGTALFPDSPYDKDGVYSGCAVVSDNTMHLFYTGNVKEEGGFDYIRNGRGSNVIHVASKDGRSMSEKQLLLTNINYPEFCSCHVRDPKVWYESGKWNMVLGARTLDDVGCVLLYKSDNLTDWQFVDMVTEWGYGYMWECPDIFMVSGNRFLSVSPQGMKHSEYKYQNVYQSGWFPFHFNNSFAVCGDFFEWDMGFDFYAPQTFSDSKGRHILIGWMGIGDIDYYNPTTELGWQHCLTIPRHLTCTKDGRLKQNPIAEINSLRIDELALENSGEVEAALPFDFEGTANDSFVISLEDGDNSLRLCFDSKDKLFTMSFIGDKIGAGRTSRFVEISECKTIRVIADMSSVEVYLNNGENVISTRFYPNDKKIWLKLKGVDGRMYRMKGMEVVISGD